MRDTRLEISIESLIEYKYPNIKDLNVECIQGGKTVIKYSNKDIPKQDVIDFLGSVKKEIATEEFMKDLISGSAFVFHNGKLLVEKGSTEESVLKNSNINLSYPDPLTDKEKELYFDTKIEHLTSEEITQKYGDKLSEEQIGFLKKYSKINTNGCNPGEDL
ncbi:hypothetical protein Phi46:3_gp038 [Cellulophaga phage phi46:3]|uniref:Uncharacterized protein n=1 Tax=Cellulophaga phage phi46:3 TaxID=1327985 RepID=S0A2T9_9CAUD|nr:hypothetical protein Phi46:3_gp038 [Cellulophaga phage phi46:3]AGO48782.1 hypothetical protein Phi46:3_gp038 [Cellulophaga phage phi46:3]